jgi:cytosine/adenosine deaminase-related metal-dependent hydrolase
MRRSLFSLCLILLGLAHAGHAATGSQRPILLRGAVVTPGHVLADGWVAIAESKIISISEAKPTLPGARILVTRDIIFPGFVDLHNHPLYGVFPRWNAPRTFDNRYQWRGDTGYLDAIQTPEGEMVRENFCDMDAFAEMQALAGGTTSLLGFYQPADAPEIPPCIEGLARNLDWASGFHGPGVGREPIANVLGVRAGDMKLSPQASEMLKTGAFDLLAVHLSEGRRGDAATRAEFEQLKRLQLLTPRTAVIHGIGLTAADFGELHAAGAALVWSPRSNFALYGETADIPAAVRADVVMALAPDWSPTGSINMLAEIAYAARVAERDFPGLLEPDRLFRMATVIPAQVAKIADKVGSLVPGRFADLFLLRGDAKDVYEALAHARPEDVTLTMVGGTPLYGEPRNLAALGVRAPETVAVCGRRRGVNAEALPPGGLAGVRARLARAMAKHGLRLAEFADCAAADR